MGFFVSFNIVLPVPLVLFFSTNSQCSHDLDLDYLGFLDIIIIIIILSIAFAIVCLGFYDTDHFTLIQLILLIYVQTTLKKQTSTSAMRTFDRISTSELSI